jgi:hypothetical protein
MIPAVGMERSSVGEVGVERCAGIPHIDRGLDS